MKLHEYGETYIMPSYIALSSSPNIIKKGKGIPITGNEDPWGMWMQGSTYSQPRHEDEVGWLVLRSAVLTAGEIPRYSFYRRSSGPQGGSGQEGVKKNLHPSDTRDRTRALQPVVNCLAA